jgi:choline dehydrogenase-like flavoprotein
MNLRCRELVIGSGPGGSVTAGLLAEAGRDVILLEEGPADSAAAPAPFSLQEMAERYRNRGLNPVLGRPKIAFAEGRCLGGGSEINSGLFHRLPPETLEDWSRRFSLVDAGPERMAPDFEAVERSICVSKSAGPVPAAARLLRDGAAAMGWNCVEVPRWFRHAAGADSPVRMTMKKTWIPRAQQAGARVLSDCRIHRLQRDGPAWLAVGEHAGRRISCRADAVFVCAGAIQTPLLLRRSGFRGSIGNTLGMHPTIKVVALFDEEVNYEGLGVPFFQVKEFSPRLTFGSSISSLPHLALAMLDHPQAAERVCANWRHAAVYYVSVTGAPTGRIRGIPFTREALVRYQIAPEELRDLASGMRNLCRLLLAAGAVELFSSISAPRAVRTMDDLAAIPDSVPRSRTNVMAIHAFCSSRMAGNPGRGALDSWGRLWNIPGLSVHDASVFCDSPGVNPQGGVMAFAHRNTRRYLDGG